MQKLTKKAKAKIIKYMDSVLSDAEIDMSKYQSDLILDGDHITLNYIAHHKNKEIYIAVWDIFFTYDGEVLQYSHPEINGG